MRRSNPLTSAEVPWVEQRISQRVKVYFWCLHMRVMFIEERRTPVEVALIWIDNPKTLALRPIGWVDTAVSIRRQQLRQPRRRDGAVPRRHMIAKCVPHN